MVTKASGRAAGIRAKLDHPIIDSDGHLIEVLPVLIDFIKQVGGADVVKRFEDLRQRGTWMDLSPDELRDSRATASTWWLPPTKNTLDRALGVNTVEVARYSFDTSPFGKRYDPGHPAAGADGYVLLPNVNALIEMADMREAMRSYEANLSVIEASKSMLRKTVELPPR